MPFDPLVSPDHYVAGACSIGELPPFGWVIYQPVSGQAHDGPDVRLPVYIFGRHGVSNPLMFMKQADAENFAAALNHGKYLREERGT